MITSALSFARWCSECNLELWADIPDHPFYQASNLGRVRSLDQRIPYVSHGKSLTRFSKGRILASGKHPDGHLMTGLGRGFFTSVHRIVVAAFTGVWTTFDNQTRHLNGIPDDNRLFNLLPGTPKQNVEDMIRHGCFVIGEAHHRAKLTEEDVLDIRWLDANGSIPRTNVAAIYGVSSRQIDNIVLRKSWAHV